MANMTMTKTPMPEQAPDVRNKNFEEVTLGYTEEMALNEAARLSLIHICANCIEYRFNSLIVVDVFRISAS